MTTDDFDYVLPEELIAQTPLEKRDTSRLLVLDKKTGDVEHKKFYNIIDYLDKGDTLVLNDSKVLPARLIGVKEDTGAVIEILLLKNIDKDNWECLVKPARRIKVGAIVCFGEGKLKAECIKELDEGIRHFKLIYNGILLEILETLGTMPLPPYIHEKLKDQSRYQTVYAREIGSAAAPTAGLHFTKDLLKRIEDKGVNVCYITLHVGLGTFRPVSVSNVEEHEMHTEFYSMKKEVAELLNETKKRGNRIIAVGTTTARTLETIRRDHDQFGEYSGWTNIFIYPGFNFKGIDALITNFHLPKSTLIMLVSAFAGKENILNAYKVAVEEKYRFFSFGDAMFLK